MDNIVTHANEPAISVLMPVYNAEKYVSAAVQSILDQSFKNFEFIIIDDGSTDGSSAILENYANQDPRINLIKQTNQGLITALNLGLKACNTSLIARMDADDISVNSRLEMLKQYMDKNPDIVALGSAIKIIDETGREFETAYYPSSGKKLDQYLYTRGSPFAHPSVILRKNAVLQVNGYRPAYKHAEDYDLWLRLHKIGRLDNLQVPLLKYRHHKNSISAKNTKQQAIVSVIARHASQMKSDPTQNLKRLDRQTLDIFKADPLLLEWEILDIQISGLLVSPTKKRLDDVAQKLPTKTPAEAKVFAASTHQKLCFSYFKCKDYSSASSYFLKAMRYAPKQTLKKLLKRLI